jgi:hypothetical protein
MDEGHEFGAASAAPLAMADSRALYRRYKSSPNGDSEGCLHPPTQAGHTPFVVPQSGVLAHPSHAAFSSMVRALSGPQAANQSSSPLVACCSRPECGGAILFGTEHVEVGSTSRFPLHKESMCPIPSTYLTVSR